MKKEPFETMLNTLKTAGYRLTPQRKAIVRVLAESKEHPSAQMVFDLLHPAFDSLSLATVYNTLETLRQLGAINVLGEVGGDGAVRYDADMGPHINLACIRCHRIVDIESESVNQLNKEVESSSGYNLLGARVLYYGICPDCQARSNMVARQSTEA